MRVLDADDQNPGFFFDKYSAELPDVSGQGIKLQVRCCVSIIYVLVLSSTYLYKKKPLGV